MDGEVAEGQPEGLDGLWQPGFYPKTGKSLQLKDRYDQVQSGV